MNRSEAATRFLRDLYLVIHDGWKRVSGAKGAGFWTRDTIATIRDHVVQHMQTQPGKVEFAASARDRSGSARYEAGYLTDFAAWRVFDDQPLGGSNLAYRGLELIGEIEWSPDRDDREYDFAKLTDVRARHRVFVCAAKVNTREEALREVIDRLQQFIDRHEFVPRGETYLVIVCGYGRDSETPESDWGWIVSKEQSPVSLDDS